MIETATFDPHCWISCLKLGPNGSDPEDCKLRADEGLSAIGELSPVLIYQPGNIFSPATSVFNPLIKFLAEELSYDGLDISMKLFNSHRVPFFSAVNSMIGAPYDWRLAPTMLEQRDSFFSTLKFKLETSVRRHRRPAVVVAHSMGCLLFLYFIDWLQYVHTPKGGHEKWLQQHVWALVGFAAPLLGAPIALKSVISGHTFGLTISEEQSRTLHLSSPSSHILNPRIPASSEDLGEGLFNAGTSYDKKAETGDDAVLNSNANNSKRSDFAHTYHEPLVTVKSHSGGSQMSFTVHDIENGEIFQWLGTVFKDTLLAEKYESLHRYYLQDPLQPLSSHFARPPIKHVVMVYGVDLPTEISYVYRIKENKNDGGKSRNEESGGALLEEIHYEQPCGEYSVKVNQSETGVSVSELKVAIDSQSGSCDASDHTTSAIISLNNSLDMCEDNGSIVDDSVSIINQNIQLVMNITKNTNVSSFAVSDCLVDYDDNYTSRSDTKILVEKISQGVGKNKYYHHNCQTEIHMLRTVNKFKDKKVFLKLSNQSHSGDITVPYISLSYAHSWLDKTNSSSNTYSTSHIPEMTYSRGKAWSPLKFNLPGSMVTSPAIDVFESKHISSNYYPDANKSKTKSKSKSQRNSNRSSSSRFSRNKRKVAIQGATTMVAEVYGVDHTEIAKNHDVHKWLFNYLLPMMQEEFAEWDESSPQHALFASEQDYTPFTFLYHQLLCSFLSKFHGTNRCRLGNVKFWSVCQQYFKRKWNDLIKMMKIS